MGRAITELAFEKYFQEAAFAFTTFCFWKGGIFDTSEMLGFKQGAPKRPNTFPAVTTMPVIVLLRILPKRNSLIVMSHTT
jgi:hypothetical protein